MILITVRTYNTKCVVVCEVSWFQPCKKPLIGFSLPRGCSRVYYVHNSATFSGVNKTVEVDEAKLGKRIVGV